MRFTLFLILRRLDRIERILIAAFGDEKQLKRLRTKLHGARTDLAQTVQDATPNP